MNKKIQKGIQYTAGIAFLAVAAVVIIHGNAPTDLSSKAEPAGAVTLSAAQQTMSVPQFGVNVGDYSDCTNRLNVDNSLGDTTSGMWTPIGGGTQNGVGAVGPYNNEVSGMQAGNCIQAGLVKNSANLYNTDFRVGIRTAPGGTGTGNGDTTSFNCTNWGSWEYTPWASAGGGSSANALPIPYSNGWAGVECVQLIVQTQPLPAGISSVGLSSFGITISGGDGSTVTSQTSQTCYLDDPNVSWDQGGPTPTCSLVPNGGSKFGAASVSLGTSAYGAVETANTVPTSFDASQTLTSGTGGGAISITMKNVGTAAWPGTFTSSDQDGTQSGTCNYVYGGGSVDNAPVSGSPDGSTCSVKTNISLSGLDLVHTASNFTVSPASIPVAWNGVTKTTTYHAAQQTTETGTCTFVPYLGRGFCSVDGSNCSGSTCSVTRLSGPSWTVTYSGGGYSGAAITPGESYTFDISSMQAPSTAGAYNETWQMESNGTPFGAAFTLPVTVKSASNGIVNVQSVNSVTGGAVSASWNTPETKPTITDLCGTLCTGTSKTWNDLSTDANIIDVSPQDQSAGSLYALHGVENGSSFLAAKTPGGPLQQLFAFSRNLLFTPANAWNVCGVYGSTPCYSTSTYTPSLTLTSGSPEASFAIVWDPIAAITVSPSSWSPSATAGGSSATQAISVENSGAPGSVLSWAASSNAAWLTISPTSGAGVDQGDGSSATVTANPSGLSAGTYTGTITFNGQSSPYNPMPIGKVITKTFTVTFTVAANPSTPVTVTCSPSSVNTNGTATCTASGGDGSGYTWATDNGTITTGGTFTAPSSAGVAHVTAAAKDDPGNVSAPFTITITLPKCGSSSCQATCSPNLTATPSSIVVPESSDLTYNCSNVTSCTLYQGATQLQSVVATGGVVSSTYSVDPSVTTQYTLVCVNANYSDDSVTSNVQVQVGGPGQCEQNPNGVGCPQAQ